MSCCFPLANSHGQIRTTYERNTCTYISIYIIYCYIISIYCYLISIYRCIYTYIYIFMWQVVGK